MSGAFEIFHKIAIHSLSDNCRNNYFTELLFFPVRSSDFYCMLFQRSGENGIQIPKYTVRSQWFRPTES